MFNKSNVFLLFLSRAMFWEKIHGNGRQKLSSECYCEKKIDNNFPLSVLSSTMAQGRPGGVVVYKYTRKKFAKILKNTQNSSKYSQNYTQVYFIPEIQRKW